MISRARVRVCVRGESEAVAAMDTIPNSGTPVFVVSNIHGVG